MKKTFKLFKDAIDRGDRIDMNSFSKEGILQGTASYNVPKLTYTTKHGKKELNVIISTSESDDITALHKLLSQTRST